MRKPFLDNLRYGIVLSVAVYHVFYQFNSVGVITNVLIPGIPALDAPLYVLYPWFMAALFMISGICARYSLEKQTGKQYLKGKVRRQLIPSIAIIFLIGWSTGWVTDQYANIFGGGQVPGFAKYLVWCMSSIGVLWFLHELLLCEVVLVLIRKLDKNDRLWQLGGKANFPVICILVLGMWGSAYILNTPVIEVYRNGFYLFCFLAGYILFSHEQIQSLLAKSAPCMLAVSGVLAVIYTVHFWGQNFAALSNLKAPLTNLYAWFACLGVLGAGKRWLDKETAFTRCMASRSFGIYVLHNPLLVLLAWAMDKLLHFPVWSMYLLLPVLLALLCARRLLRPLAVGAVTALVLVGYFACSRYSSALMGEAWQYKMIALCYQTAALVQDADPVEDAEALADIDRVFDVEFCRANPETHGNELRGGMIAGRGGSAEDWSVCQKAIMKLALKYPKSMLRERAGVFYNTLRQRQNGQSNQKIAFASAFLLYEAEPTQDDQKSFLQDSAAVQPLNKELRRAFIVDMASSTDFAGGLIDLTWWMLPPFVLLGLALAVLLVQRRWMLLFAAGTFFARIPLVFLTAPDTYFMYYLTPFIAGYAVAAAAVLYAVLQRKLKSERITG